MMNAIIESYKSQNLFQEATIDQICLERNIVGHETRGIAHEK
jgi:hypothetical protein